MCECESPTGSFFVAKWEQTSVAKSEFCSEIGTDRGTADQGLAWATTRGERHLDDGESGNVACATAGGLTGENVGYLSRLGRGEVYGDPWLDYTGSTAPRAAVTLLFQARPVSIAVGAVNVDNCVTLWASPPPLRRVYACRSAQITCRHFHPPHRPHPVQSSPSWEQ